MHFCQLPTIRNLQHTLTHDDVLDAFTFWYWMIDSTVLKGQCAKFGQLVLRNNRGVSSEESAAELDGESMNSGDFGIWVQDMRITTAIAFFGAFQAFLALANAQVAGLFGLSNQGDVSPPPSLKYHSHYGIFSLYFMKVTDRTQDLYMSLYMTGPFVRSKGKPLQSCCGGFLPGKPLQAAGLSGLPVLSGLFAQGDVKAVSFLKQLAVQQDDGSSITQWCVNRAAYNSSKNSAITGICIGIHTSVKKMYKYKRQNSLQYYAHSLSGYHAQPLNCPWVAVILDSYS